MVMTAAEVTLSYMDVGWIFLPALLVLMTAKFLTVVSYFMHLKFDHKLFTFLFYTGLAARGLRVRRRPGDLPLLRELTPVLSVGIGPIRPIAADRTGRHTVACGRRPVPVPGPP